MTERTPTADRAAALDALVELLADIAIAELQVPIPPPIDEENEDGHNHD